MVVRRQKKRVRYRGSHTHGAGSKKKRRGAGNRGGRGMAGTGKRADSKKPSIWMDTKYFGKYGFTRVNVDPQREITLSSLKELLPELLDAGIASKDKDAYVLDLSKLGYDKVLAKGRFDVKLRLKARYASRGAIKKIEAAGGEITLTEVPPAASPSESASDDEFEPVEEP